MRKTVVIDCFPESMETYRDGYAIVAVDVIRATTTAVTSVALGRKCFPAPTLGPRTPQAPPITGSQLAVPRGAGARTAA